MPRTAQRNAPQNATPPTEVIELDSRGDFTILADKDGQLVHCKVSSAALAMASPFWRALTEPGRWKESTTKQIDHREDDLDALLIIFKISHMRFTELPQVLPTRILQQLGLICDKYDCLELIRPWVVGWLRAWGQRYDTRSVDREDLVIAWVFGLSKAFSHIKYDLVTKMHQDVNLNSNYVLPNGTECDYTGIPQETIAFIATARQSLMTQFSDHVHGTASNALKNGQCTEVCRLASFGWLFERLRPCLDMNGAQQTMARMSGYSVQEIYKHVLSLQVPPTGNWHLACQKDVLKKLKTSFTEDTRQLSVDCTQAELEPLNRRASKCGTRPIADESLWQHRSIHEG